MISIFVEKYQITPETPTVCFAADRVVLAAAAFKIFQLCDQILPLRTQNCQRFQLRLLLLESRTFLLRLALETFLTFACKIIFSFSFKISPFDLDLQQTPFSTPSHFMSVNCEANFCHSGVNEVMASSFASSSWKKGLIETGNRNSVHFRNFLT